MARRKDGMPKVAVDLSENVTKKSSHRYDTDELSTLAEETRQANKPAWVTRGITEQIEKRTTRAHYDCHICDRLVTHALRDLTEKNGIKTRSETSGGHWVEIVR